MRLPKALLLAGLYTLPLSAQTSLSGILSRVSEEASVFQQNMPKALTQETLEQRAALPPSRFRPRIGNTQGTALKPRLQLREIVSEYSVGTLKDSASADLVELRQVISVGRQTRAIRRKRSSRSVSLGIQSQDDRLRKRMLEDFAKNGLVDIATDYGLILLAFTKRGMENMEIVPAGEAQVGVDAALVLRWKQTSGAGGELEFHGRQATRRAMEGTLWVRKSDRSAPAHSSGGPAHRQRSSHHARSSLR